jgi:hypothetical protein
VEEVGPLGDQPSARYAEILGHCHEQFLAVGQLQLGVLPGLWLGAVHHQQAAEATLAVRRQNQSGGGTPVLSASVALFLLLLNVGMECRSGQSPREVF